MCRFPPGTGALAAFSWLFHDREGFCPHSGDKILRDHEVPAQEPGPEVTPASAGSFAPAFRAPSRLSAFIVGRYPGIAWVKPAITRGVKAAAHYASGLGGNLQVIVRRVLSPARCHVAPVPRGSWVTA